MFYNDNAKKKTKQAWHLLGYVISTLLQQREFLASDTV